MYQVNRIFTRIDKTPHLLIAGSTGSGKSVCVNTIITSILLKNKPDKVKLIMIDPKMVELSIYEWNSTFINVCYNGSDKSCGCIT